MPHNHPKVLIIDDDTDSVFFLKELMDSNGFTSVVACDRCKGLQKARGETPCCIILNCLLCGEDGLCLYRELKTCDDLKHIPVIMLSSLPSDIVYQYRIFQTNRSLPRPEAYLDHLPEADELVDAVLSLTRHVL